MPAIVSHPFFPPLSFPLAASIPVFDWRVGADALPHGLRLAAAIGNFDGVHRGHRALLENTAQIAGAIGSLTPAVIFFTPHPRRFFAPESPNFLLTDEADKIALLAEAGAKAIIRLRFDEAMRMTTAEDFIRHILPSLGVSTLVAGADFAFGRDRGGNLDLIASIGKSLGIEAIAVPLVAESGGESLSSSRARTALTGGNPDLAKKIMGRPYTISGVVQRGDRRGRQLGFPTANISLGDMLEPAFGVYAVAVRLQDQPHAPIIAGIANIGRRPSVNDRGVLLEAHLFGYNGDLYNQRITVALLDYIRPEQSFDGLDALKNAIKKDSNKARAYHHANTGLITP